MPAAARDQRFTERGSRVSRDISEKMITLLMARRQEIKHPDPVLAVDFGLRTAFDVLDLTTFYVDVQRTKLSLTTEQLGEELTRMFLSYLGIESPASWEASSRGESSVDGDRGQIVE